MGNKHLYRGIIVVFVTLSFYSRINAQNTQSGIDSLTYLLKQEKSDTQKTNLLIELASAFPCNDTNRLKYAMDARNIALYANWVKGIINSDLAIGNIYFSCANNYDNALKYYLQADTVSYNSKDMAQEVIALRDIATTYQHKGSYGLAIEYYRQVISLNSSFDEEMGAWGNMGVEYNNIGDYNQALTCYYHSLKILSDLSRNAKSHDQQDTAQLAGLLLNIGDVYMEMSLPERAFGNYDSVYKIGKAIRNQTLQVIGLMGMGEVYNTQHNYPLAIGSYTEAMGACLAMNDYSGQIKCLNKLAIAYMGKNDLAQAMQLAQNALKLALEKANSEQLPKVYITLGRIYAQQKDYKNAAAYLQKALAISQQTNARSDEKDAWYALVDAYKLMHQPENALDAYEHYITIRDSVYNIAKANEITRQELDYNYKSQELANKLNYEKQLARQQLFIYFGIAVIVLLLLLAFFIFRNYKTQKKYNDLLHREKQRHLAHIEEQDSVLMDIANIQSHRVRGPVATILGLVQIFNYNDLSDPINKEVMEGLGKITEKLDVAVKEVIQRENQSRAEQHPKNKQ